MSQESTLFVGNLDPSLSAEEAEAFLVELFTQCGAVQSIRLPTDGSGRNKGFAFVEMCTVEGSMYATLALNGLKLNGRYLRLACAMENEKEVQLRLENLPQAAVEADMYEALSHRVTSIRGIAVRRNHAGRSEGKAIVWFSSVALRDIAKQTLSKELLFLESQQLKVF